MADKDLGRGGRAALDVNPYATYTYIKLKFWLTSVDDMVDYVWRTIMSETVEDRDYIQPEHETVDWMVYAEYLAWQLAQGGMSQPK